jgi:predicted ArsR family transcriptional regulator
MEVPPAPDDDVLALPVRARLVEALGELRRPATTDELARRVGRHPSSARTQLQTLADAGLLERRTARQVRGRPRDEWAIAPGATPAGRPPEAYGQLSRWLARALVHGGDLAMVEHAGREIGRELAPAPSSRPLAETMRDALTALGFSPREDPAEQGRLRYVLCNCPYRDAVRQNQPAVCSLHKGITAGLLDRLDPGARLTDFVAKDPYDAGCLVELATANPQTA